MEHTDLRQAVRDQYGAIARAAGRSCCGTTGCGCGSPVTSNLYSPEQTGELPAGAVSVSLGCGNPTALASLEPGQTVLDLGSGGGIDVLLSARRVGPTGKAYGLDMTDEMLALAREHQRQAGIPNAEFLKGTIEAIPLPDASVDVIISNCVINLSPDKDAVFREAFRVLKPGGRLAISDIVMRRALPADLRTRTDLWAGCIAGALDEQTYASKLQAAGFHDVSLETWRVYDGADAESLLAETGIDLQGREAEIDGAIASAFVRATRPLAAPCCSTTCCSA